MLLAPGCPHCAAVLNVLAELVKQGDLAALEVVNVEVAPERAEALGVRSVPWVRMGAIELEGAHSPAELRHWAQQARTDRGLTNYMDHLLASGQMSRVARMVKDEPKLVRRLLDLLVDADRDINVHVGISAVFEELSETDILRDWVDELGELTRSVSTRVRADACHFLAFARSSKAVPYLKAALQDPDRNVREIAGESLDALSA